MLKTKVRCTMREKEEEEFNQSGVCVRGTNAGLCLMSTLPRYCPEPAGPGGLATLLGRRLGSHPSRERRQLLSLNCYQRKLPLSVRRNVIFTHKE